jgi:hypothetical protein
MILDKQEGVLHTPGTAKVRPAQLTQRDGWEGTAMATTLKACGRMTRDIETPYEVGQRVVLVEPDKNDHGVRAGDRGVIRRIIISAPNDGDATFPMFYIRVQRGRYEKPITTLFHASEFVPAAEADAYLWARRQLNGL